MDWALENGSANILTHLRDLGYAIPEDLIWKYQDSVACYLLSEYPLKVISSFTHVICLICITCNLLPNN